MATKKTTTATTKKATAVKKAPEKKEATAKKEATVKKETPVKKEITVKKETTAKKETSVKKETPIKKKPAPIAAGETFTALQIAGKGAEGESMEQRLRLLYELQKVDSKIDEIYLLRGELPLEVEDLQDEIMGLKTKGTALLKECKDMETFITGCKHDVADCKAAIKKYEQQRNNVKNNREFDSLSKEIEYQELESQLAEQKAEKATKALAEKKAAAASLKEEVKGREIDLENKRQELETISKETEIEEKALVKRSQELQAQIEPRMLAAYEKVRSNARNKRAVVTVVRGACGGCFNKIPPQRELDIEESKRIIVCEYCGRILVSSHFDDEKAGE